MTIAIWRFLWFAAPAERDASRARAAEWRGETTASVAEARQSSEDAALIARVRAGNEAAFEELVREYSRGLLTLALVVLGTRADAEDVVQDVLLRVWAAREAWVPRGSVRAYLAAAVRRRAVDVVRHRRVVTRNAPLLAASDEAVLPAFEDPDDDARLWAAIEALDVRWREAITLRYVNQLGYADVGRALGVSPDAARMTVKRAVEALRAALAG